MIIKSFRVPTSESLSRRRDHIFRGEENAEVHVLRGTEADLADFRDLAVDRGATYALRHFIIAPGEPMTVEELLGVVDHLASEFGFDSSICVVILHRKPRREGDAENHLHVLVPEVNATTGGVLSSSHDYVRHEKIARVVEHRHGHPFVEGKHLPAVLAALREEGRHAVHDALAAAFPEPARPTQAFSTVNARRVARETGLDLAGLKIEIRKLWRAEASAAAIASRLAEHGIELRIGDKPGTLVLTKVGVHVAALHRLLGLRKEVAFKEFQHVAADDAARRSSAEFVPAAPAPAEPRPVDPTRDASHPVPDRGDNPSGQPERRRRRRRSDPVDAGRSSVGSEGVARAESERRGASPAPRRSDPARARRRRVEARIRAGIADEDRARLAEQKRLAGQLAVSASAALEDWLDGRLQELDEEEAVLLAPFPTSSAALDRARGDEAAMQEVVASHRREIAKVEAEIAETERASRSGFLQLWAKRQPSSDLDELRSNLAASNSRLAQCEKLRRQASTAVRTAHQEIVNRAYFAELARPGKLANLADRRQAVETLRRELTDQPWKVFGGPILYLRLFDRILPEVDERIDNYPTDYKNRTDMWGIGQLRRTP